MPSLRDLELQPEYRSDEANLVDSFYVPCLRTSLTYSRAVGYFTSAGLALAAKGLAEFIGHDGRMRLIASPHLHEDDARQIQLGYTARSAGATEAVLRVLEELGSFDEASVERQRVACLAWLVAQGRLDIKLALRTSHGAESIRGIYHEKVGVFADAQGNSVAFSGSANETVGGLLSNFEAIDVFWSWEDAQGRVSRKAANFERLWANDTAGLEVMEFPEAARRQLLELRTDQPPLGDPESTHGRTLQVVKETAASYTVPDFQVPENLVLYPHQDEAIKAWNATEGRFDFARRAGFLEMATGAGKTITALSAATGLYEELGQLAIVVVVPGKVLVEQWFEVAVTFGLSPVRADSDYPKWRSDAWSAARSYRRGHLDRAMVIVSNASFATGDFQQLVSEFGEPLLLIADEAHNLGASWILEHLPPQVQYRLALSATPRRHFDDEGTQQLFDYFGESVYQFTLRDAIGICLTPYDYFITPVEMTDDEMAQYQDLTAQIARTRGGGRDNEEDRTRAVKLLRIKRARVISSAERKVEALSELLEDVDLRGLRHTFVYVSDKDPEQIEQVLRVLQGEKRLLVHQFTDQETGDTRQRTALLERFASGDDLQVLVAKRCLDEGVDIPPTRRAYFLASTTNPRQYIQRRGRLLRTFPGKTHAVIHDLMVIPPEDKQDVIDETDRSVISSELRRVAEFASSARNGERARLSLAEVARRYGVLDILSEGDS